ncbi:hypothetical protein DACRYDRAFT_25536 [Dacryopinax primogenitus]|uniref:Uncharacterized protein n=1 Tax=Dacryopinax primogenitus (strain DJM 731) TaxID=1858805 RepID=M5FZ10_DACPD|nr:uncharacterized protein DACRYDRAFT_25536 [Dacryopinax primogenitus]EJT96712.1 hypothetical protein DACRYDRAFT_25536 [Dacryopinax primogenitus]
MSTGTARFLSPATPGLYENQRKEDLPRSPRPYRSRHLPASSNNTASPLSSQLLAQQPHAVAHDLPHSPGGRMPPTVARAVSGFSGQGYRVQWVH